MDPERSINQVSERQTIVVAATGDLILDVSDESGREHFSYKVNASILRRSSSYFDRLLSGTFSEGATVQTTHCSLLEKYANISLAPDDELPHIHICDIGKTSKVSSIRNITADFLRVIHGLDLSSLTLPVANLANLAIVADRFDALAPFSKHVRQKRYIQATEAKVRSKANTNLTEEKARQRLLIGLLLDHPPWVAVFSKWLIIRGSVRWRPEAINDPAATLWWDLPGGVEDELMYRRDCVLETISSLQSHFLGLYISGGRQCKLDYDSSTQCDSFQLGEMVRFFARTSTLRLGSTIYDETEPGQYFGGIDRLIDSLRQCPSYQIDRNHTHCGLRSRLSPLLDLMQTHVSLNSTSLDIGICADCWHKQKSGYAWIEAKRPFMWTRSALPIRWQGRESSQTDCNMARHLKVRDLFTAVERDWTETGRGTAVNLGVRPVSRDPVITDSSPRDNFS